MKEIFQGLKEFILSLRQYLLHTMFALAVIWGSWGWLAFINWIAMYYTDTKALQDKLDKAKDETIKANSVTIELLAKENIRLSKENDDKKTNTP